MDVKFFGASERSGFSYHIDRDECIMVLTIDDFEYEFPMPDSPDECGSVHVADLKVFEMPFQDRDPVCIVNIYFGTVHQSGKYGYICMTSGVVGEGNKKSDSLTAWEKIDVVLPK